jgi:predicted CopG family antitoxin
LRFPGETILSQFGQKKGGKVRLAQRADLTISDDLYRQIRKAKNEGKSKSQAARELKMSRTTVRRHWDGAKIPGEKNQDLDKENVETSYQKGLKTVVINKILEYVEQIKDSLGKKQRLTKKMIYEYITKYYVISYPTLCRYIKELNIIDKKVYIPLAFEPGEVMQVDWCDALIDVNGDRRSYSVFCAVLPYSGAIFAMVTYSKKMEYWLQAHIKALEYFNGVPKIVFYDNLKQSVMSGAAKNAVLNKKFIKIVSHYGFEPRFMNINSGNEKGSVENLCKSIRTIALTPIPKVSSLKEAQTMIQNKISAHNDQHKLKTRPLPIKELFEREKIALQPLPLKPYNPIHNKIVTVDHYLTFSYDTCKYSVPYEYRNQQITLEIQPYEILCWYKGKLIFTHTKSIMKEQKILFAEHYLPLLISRNRAIEHAIPLKYGILPDELDTFRTKCKDKDKLLQLVDIMMLCEKIDTKIVLQAVNEANKSVNPTYNYILNIIKLNTLDLTLDTDKENLKDQIINKNTPIDDFNLLIPKKDYRKESLDVSNKNKNSKKED